MKPQLLTIAQFSLSTGVSASTLYRKTASGQIPSVRVAGQVRIPYWYLEELTSRPGDLPTWIKGGNDND
jgi:excisionase family DNA binding protein